MTWTVRRTAEKAACCFLGSTENSQSSLSDSSNTYRQLWSVAKGRAGQQGRRGFGIWQIYMQISQSSPPLFIVCWSAP